MFVKSLSTTSFLDLSRFLLFHVLDSFLSFFLDLSLSFFSIFIYIDQVCNLVWTLSIEINKKTNINIFIGKCHILDCAFIFVEDDDHITSLSWFLLFEISFFRFSSPRNNVLSKNKWTAVNSFLTAMTMTLSAIFDIKSQICWLLCQFIGVTTAKHTER